MASVPFETVVSFNVAVAILLSVVYLVDSITVSIAIMLVDTSKNYNVVIFPNTLVM